MEGTMRMSKTQIAIVIFLCIAVIIIILSFGRPQPKPAATAVPEAKTEEQVLPQAGKYELPPAQENAGYPTAQNVNTPAAAPAPATAGTSTENTQNTDNSLGAGSGNPPQTYEPDPSLPKKPPKLPPPEKLQQF